MFVDKLSDKRHLQMSGNAMREMVMLPENRPAMRLLMRSTMYMVLISISACIACINVSACIACINALTHAHTQVGIPIAVYYFCYNTVFGEQGLSPVHDFNWRVNYSGFAAIAAVQVRCVCACVMSRLCHAYTYG